MSPLARVIEELNQTTAHLRKTRQSESQESDNGGEVPAYKARHCHYGNCHYDVTMAPWQLYFDNYKWLSIELHVDMPLSKLKWQ